MATDRQHSQPAQAVAVHVISTARANGNDSLKEEGPCLAKAGRCQSERWRSLSPLMPADLPENPAWWAMGNKLLDAGKVANVEQIA